MTTLGLLRAISALACLFVVSACGLLTTKPERQIATFEAKQTTLVREVEALGALMPVKATRIAPPSDLDAPLKIAYLAEDGTYVRQGDIVVRFDDGDFQRSVERETFDGRGAAAKLEKERTLGHTLLDTRRRSIELAQREQKLVQRFQRKDAEIFSGHQIIESEIDQDLQKSKVEYAERAEQLEAELAKTKLGLLSVDRSKATLALRQAEKALGKLEIQAPHAGVFVLERNWLGEAYRVGDTVPSSRTIIAQIPLLDTMQAEVFVLEADAEGLEPGRAATFVLDAAPHRVFTGKVRRVESIAKRRYSGVPTQYFAVTLALAETDPLFMKPGKRITSKLNLGSVSGVVVPRQAVFEKDQTFFVFRKTPAGDFAQVPVSLGSSTAGRVLILRGVAPGELVALSDPNRVETTEAKEPANPERPSLPASGPRRKHEN